MPHNLYLHSALVHSRKLKTDDVSVRRALRFNTIDTVIALTVAFFVNAAILVLAAMVFNGKTSVQIPGGEIVHFNDDTDWIRVAYLTLAPLLGATIASTLFAVAFLQAVRVARSLARWRAKWSWRDSCTGAFNLGCARLVYTTARHRACDSAYRSEGRCQRHRVVGSQPSRTRNATALRNVSLDAFHELAKMDGFSRQWLVAPSDRLGIVRVDYGGSTSMVFPKRLRNAWLVLKGH